jgi:hypothetical protein
LITVLAYLSLDGGGGSPVSKVRKMTASRLRLVVILFAGAALAGCDGRSVGDNLTDSQIKLQADAAQNDELQAAAEAQRFDGVRKTPALESSDDVASDEEGEAPTVVQSTEQPAGAEQAAPAATGSTSADSGQ